MRKHVQVINHGLLKLAFFLTLFCLAPVNAAQADDNWTNGDRAVVSGYKTIRSNIALAEPLGQSSLKSAMQQTLTANLNCLPFVNIVPGNSVPGGANLPVASGQGLDLKRFQLAGVDILVTSNWVRDGQVELRAYQPFSGENMFGNLYTVAGGASGVDNVADKFCAQLLERLIGNGNFFRSTLAFVKTSGPKQKDVWIVRPTGRGLRQITNIRGEAMSPSWSKDASRIIFTSIEPRTHGLGLWNAATGQTSRVQFPGNTVIAPCFLPSGDIAVSLTDGNSPSIFLLNPSLQRKGKLISSSGIDVSPSVDATGSKMVFTSSRAGNPHIYLQDMRSGSVRRISNEGKYNSDPSISPDGNYVVYCRMMGGGHQLIVHELATGKESQITFEGSNEQPEFAPDGYFIAFMSTRSGTKKIYLTTRFGGTAKEVATGAGDASFPAWGLVDR